MRRLLLAAAAILTPVCLLRLRCYIRGQHSPMRHFLGAFRCSLCGTAGADYESMGYGQGSGYVEPLRHVHSRENGGTVERSSW